MQHERVVQQVSVRFAAAAELLAEAEPHIVTVCAYPKVHWQQIWSNNPLERLNKAIRCRIDDVGMFPNWAAAVRLMGATLGERHYEWRACRRYLAQAAQPDSHETFSQEVVLPTGMH